MVKFLGKFWTALRTRFEGAKSLLKYHVGRASRKKADTFRTARAWLIEADDLKKEFSGLVRYARISGIKIDALLLDTVNYMDRKLGGMYDDLKNSGRSHEQILSDPIFSEKVRRRNELDLLRSTWNK